MKRKLKLSLILLLVCGFLCLLFSIAHVYNTARWWNQSTEVVQQFFQSRIRHADMIVIVLHDVDKGPQNTVVVSKPDDLRRLADTFVFTSPRRSGSPASAYFYVIDVVDAGESRVSFVLVGDSVMYGPATVHLREPFNVDVDTAFASEISTLIPLPPL